MIRQKQDFFIFSDYDQYGYGSIKKLEFDSVVLSELNLDDDGTYQFLINTIKDDRTGDISLRKVKEGIEKERDARLLYEDLIDLVKE